LHFSNLGPQLNELFLSALQAKQGDVLVLYTVDMDGGPGVAFMAPVISVDSEVVDKVILIEFNLSIIKQIDSEFDDRIVGDKFVYLVDNQGKVIVSEDTNAPTGAVFPDWSVEPELTNFFKNQGEARCAMYQDAYVNNVVEDHADATE